MDDYDPNALPVATAQQIVASLVEPVMGTERLFVRNALGRVLAEDVISPIDVPAHNNAAMDGYGVRAADLASDAETALQVIGTAFAGRPFAGDIAAGQAVRIMTGGVLPPSVDTVVIQEVSRTEGDRLWVPPGQKAGQNTRRAGEDLRAGTPALAAGRRLVPADIGLIASLGIAEVTVRRRVRVAFFSTGDELVSLGQQPTEGQIFDSNRYTIYAMLAQFGVDIIDMGVVPDEPARLEAAFRQAIEQADAIITSGGVSVGEADFIKQLMATLGEVLFWKIAMKPGRPMAFGRIASGNQSAFLFGLPGNPVAVMVTFYQFVRDALHRMAGVRPLLPVPLLPATCASNLKKAPGRTEFQRGVLFQEQGEWHVRLTGAQGSGILRSMSEANCFIVLEHERGSIKAGDIVQVQLMEGLA
jgi:molybdopterin molybdotransferase